jgi:hypothetical protein
MLGVLTSRIASIAFGALPVTIFLPVFLMVLLIVLPQAFSALFGYSSPPIDAMLLVISWIDFGFDSSVLQRIRSREPIHTR